MVSTERVLRRDTHTVYKHDTQVFITAYNFCNMGYFSRFTGDGKAYHTTLNVYPHLISWIWELHNILSFLSITKAEEEEGKKSHLVLSVPPRHPFFNSPTISSWRYRFPNQIKTRKLTFVCLSKCYRFRLLQQKDEKIVLIQPLHLK